MHCKISTGGSCRRSIKYVVVFESFVKGRPRSRRANGANATNIQSSRCNIPTRVDSPLPLRSSGAVLTRWLHFLLPPVNRLLIVLLLVKQPNLFVQTMVKSIFLKRCEKQSELAHRQNLMPYRLCNTIKGGC